VSDSRVPGCRLLHNAQLALPICMDMQSSKIPCLCLEDMLKDQGFVGVRGVVHHLCEDEDRYDSMDLASKRWYLRCVLACGTIYARGNTFTSNGSQRYYELLLKSKTMLARGKPANYYKELLDKIECSDLVCPALEYDVNRARSLPPLAIRFPAPPPLEDLPRAFAPSDEEGPVGVAALVDVGPEGSGDNVADGGNDGDGGDCIVAPMPDDSEPTLPPATASSSSVVPVAHHYIEGARVFKTREYVSHRSIYQARWKVVCRNTKHFNCSRTRGVMMDSNRHLSCFRPRLFSCLSLRCALVQYSCPFVFRACTVEVDLLSCAGGHIIAMMFAI
jgi:hypothetical protein